jgi:hypothetical protein
MQFAAAGTDLFRPARNLQAEKAFCRFDTGKENTGSRSRFPVDRLEEEQQSSGTLEREIVFTGIADIGSALSAEKSFSAESVNKFQLSENSYGSFSAFGNIGISCCLYLLGFNLACGFAGN